MKDYTGKDNITGMEHEVLGTRAQNTEQFDNYSVSLVRVLENGEDGLTKGMVLLREDIIADVNEFILNDDEIEHLDIDGIDEYLKSCASAWANNGEEDHIVEMCRWLIHEPDDYAYKGTSPCCVLVKGFYNGYTPINFVKDSEGDVLTFRNSDVAQAWINKEEEGTYYLSHNEAGRPAYTIVESNEIGIEENVDVFQTFPANFSVSNTNIRITVRRELADDMRQKGVVFEYATKCRFMALPKDEYGSVCYKLKIETPS